MDTKKQRSILQEISTFVPKKNCDEVVAMRGERVISSAINLLEMVEKNYSDEEYDQLCKKLLASIRSRDQRKFEKGLQKIKEDRDG